MNYSVQIINKSNELDNGVYEFESEEMANQFVQDCVAQYTFLPKQMGYVYTYTDSGKNILIRAKSLCLSVHLIRMWK